jgi:hypothetical protein
MLASEHCGEFHLGPFPFLAAHDQKTSSLRVQDADSSVDLLETTGDNPRTDHVHFVKKALHVMTLGSSIGVVPDQFCRATRRLPDRYDDTRWCNVHLTRCAGIAGDNINGIGTSRNICFSGSSAMIRIQQVASSLKSQLISFIGPGRNYDIYLKARHAFKLVDIISA